MQVRRDLKDFNNGVTSNVHNSPSSANDLLVRTWRQFTNVSYMCDPETVHSKAPHGCHRLVGGFVAPRTPSLVAHPRAAWPELSFADLGIGRSDWVTRAGPAESQAPLKAANFPAEEEDIGGQNTEKGTLLARRWREPHGKPERERNLHTSHCGRKRALRPGERLGWGRP